MTDSPAIRQVCARPADAAAAQRRTPCARGTWCALLAVTGALAAPAVAAAHPRSATVALDYRLVLSPTAPGVTATVLDGDRDLRVDVPKGTLVVLGDLGEPMLRIGAGGVSANRASVTAVSEKLTASGSGWKRLASGSSYVWHEHRLSPPPYDGSRLGAVARFTIPATFDGRRGTIAGTFVRVRRPLVWPWLAGIAASVVAVAALVRLRPSARRPATMCLGIAAAAASLTAFVSFATADSTTGHTAWAEIAVAGVLAAALVTALIRLRGLRRAHLAGVIGAAAAALSLESLGVFRHGVVISSLPAGAGRALCAIACVGGATALVASIGLAEEQ